MGHEVNISITGPQASGKTLLRALFTATLKAHGIPFIEDHVHNHRFDGDVFKVLTSEEEFRKIIAATEELNMSGGE